jgi:hypothetical protein
MRRSLYIAAALAVCLSGCKKNLNLDLDDAGPHIVIQGEITDAAGPYTVRVNQSVTFKAENTFPPVSGASIKISDGQGHTDSLTEISPGVYSTSTLLGIPGNTYRLSAQIADTLYTATSTMPFRVPFDSITFRTNSAFGDDHITAVPNFQDPAGVKNFYLFNEYQDGLLLTKDIFVFDDRLSDGKYITRGLRNTDATLNDGDSLEIKMYCIDEPIYNYFNQLAESGGGGGGGAFNTAAAPANPISNISGGALGYFSAHTIQSRKIKVFGQ